MADEVKHNLRENIIKKNNMVYKIAVWFKVLVRRLERMCNRIKENTRRYNHIRGEMGATSSKKKVIRNQQTC